MESHIQALTEATSAAVDNTVIVSNQGRRTSQEIVRGIRVIRTGRACTVAGAPLCPSMAWHIARFNADIVHIHLPNPGAVLSYLASRHRGKLVLTEHGEVFGRRALKATFRPFLMAALKRASAVVATSEAYVAYSSVLSAVPHKCYVIPLGIRTNPFEWPDIRKVSEVKARFPGPLYVAVGRLVGFKGFQYLIPAMASVEGTLLIIGDGPLASPLRELAIACGLAGRVHQLGAVPNPDVAPYLQAADIFVLPSIESRESFGIVQLEAMVCGKPVINTSLKSGVPLVSLDGITGLTVPPADTAALAAAMTRLARDPELREKFGEAARVRVKREFTAEMMARRTLDLYRRVLGEERQETGTNSLAALAAALAGSAQGQTQVLIAGQMENARKSDDPPCVQREGESTAITLHEAGLRDTPPGW
jgi:rhamnosyl/mannosyltransferase